MAPLKMSLDAQYKGDTWDGFSLDSILIDGALPTVAMTSAKMQFRSKTNELGFEYNTVETNCKGLITIDTAATWAMTIEPEILPMDTGVWWWDLEVVDVNGRLKTILAGRLRIIADVTQR